MSGKALPRKRVEDLQDWLWTQLRGGSWREAPLPPQQATYPLSVAATSSAGTRPLGTSGAGSAASASLPRTSSVIDSPRVSRPVAMNANHEAAPVNAATPMTMATHPTHRGNARVCRVAPPTDNATTATPAKTVIQRRSSLIQFNVAATSAGIFD